MIPATSEALLELSPSRLERLRCRSRVAFEQGAGGVGPQSADALLGKAVHLAVELVLNGSALGDAWDEASEELASGGPDPRSLPRARRARLRFEARAPELLELVAEVAAERQLCEEDLRSADGVLWGRADLVLLGADFVVVIDHKAGLVAHDEVPEASYALQLQFYAALAQEQFGVPATRAALLSMRQGTVDVAVDAEVLASVVASARTALAGYNSSVPGRQPPNPSLETCRWCSYKPRCEGFWGEVDSDWIESIGGSMQATTKGTPEVAANGLAAVVVEVSDGSVPPGEYTLAGVPAALLEGVGVQAHLAVTGLRVDEEHRVAHWRDQSLLSMA